MGAAADGFALPFYYWKRKGRLLETWWFLTGDLLCFFVNFIIRSQLTVREGGRDFNAELSKWKWLRPNLGHYSENFLDELRWIEKRVTTMVVACCKALSQIFPWGMSKITGNKQQDTQSRSTIDPGISRIQERVATWLPHSAEILFVDNFVRSISKFSCHDGWGYNVLFQNFVIILWEDRARIRLWLSRGNET